MTNSEIIAAIEDCYGRTFNENSVTIGKDNFRGFKEVFVGSQYAGYIHPVNGFVGDSHNWTRL